MIKLNIISPRLKKEIKYKIFYNSLKDILFIILISLLTHSALLFTAKFILQAHANETNSRNILATSQTEDYDKKVKNINSQVDYINEIQDDTVIWSQFIRTISNTVNPGITVTRVSANQGSNSFNISGHAETRQDLLNLKESLERLDLFASISIPIEILLQKSDISFSINTKFKSYEFK